MIFNIKADSYYRDLQVVIFWVKKKSVKKCSVLD